MRGAILELNLPNGISNSHDNSSYVRITPISAGAAGFIQQSRIPISTLEEFLSAYQTGAPQTFSRGDILTFVATLNVFNLDIGQYNAEGKLSYVDQWGTRRTVNAEIPITILGRTEYVGIYMNGSLSVRKRFTEALLTIVNFGSSPMYDVYIMVSPYRVATLIPSPSVIYVKNISPNERREIPITLAYNPLGSITQGGSTMITYGPVPLMISVIYRDASGMLKSFNNTITIIVEPFIDLRIKNIKATGTKSSSTISGTIVNYGSATAYRVEVSLEVNNVVGSTLIGDVDPGSEVAFRIDVPGYNETGVLRISYYNVFNELSCSEMVVKITLREEAVVPVQKKEVGIETWIIVGAVAVFLAVSAFLIYRFLKTHSTSRSQS